MHKFLHPIVVSKSEQTPSGSFEEGSIYYDDNLKTIRHFQDGSWKILPVFSSLFGVPAPLLTSVLTVCPFAVNATATTTLSMLNNTTFWIPFSVNRKTTVTQIRINVGTAASDSSQAIGIYSSLHTTLYPDLLLGSVTLSTNSTGLKTGTLTSPIYLYPGIYWIAIASVGTPTLTALEVGATASFAFFGINRVNHYRSTGSTLPTNGSGVTFTTNVTALPLVLLTISF